MKVAIAGAGLVGRVLALTLHRLGWQIHLYDQDDVSGHGSAGYVAAGMLAPLSELEKTEKIIFELGQRSLSLWPELLTDLPLPVFFQRAGTLITAHGEEQAELLRVMGILAKRHSAPQAIICPDITLKKHLEPELQRLPAAYYLAEEGQVDAQGFFRASTLALKRKDIAWQSGCHVTSVEPHTISWHQYGQGMQTQRFDLVFDCRGLGGKQYFSDLRGVRGEVIHLHAPEVHINRPIRFFHPRYRIYIVPRPGQHYIIGASELETEEMSPISVRSTMELLSAAFSLHPGFAEARILKTAVACRPATADHAPRILYQEGLIAINGLFRHGYLLAPALVEAVVAFLQQGLTQIKYPEIFKKLV